MGARARSDEGTATGRGRPREDRHEKLRIELEDLPCAAGERGRVVTERGQRRPARLLVLKAVIPLSLTPLLPTVDYPPSEILTVINNAPFLPPPLLPRHPRPIELSLRGPGAAIRRANLNRSHFSLSRVFTTIEQRLIRIAKFPPNVYRLGPFVCFGKPSRSLGSS